MEKILVDKYGIQVVLKNDKLYVRFDVGEIAVKIKDYEISCIEAIEALQSEETAYQLCSKVQTRNLDT